MDKCRNNFAIYTSSGNNLFRDDIEKNEFIGDGNYGSVYRFDGDKAVKILDSPGSEEQYETMTLIKNLSLPNFYKIYDVLSCQSSGVKTLAGTISKYYSKEDIDIFLQPTDYLLDSFNSLYRGMEILGSNYISVYDLHKGNIIVNSDGIFVIDTDLYQKMDTDLAGRIAIRNIFKLKGTVFYELLLSNFFKHHYDDLAKFENGDVSNILYDLLNLNDFGDEKVFNKTLSKYKYPIDYMKEKSK